MSITYDELLKEALKHEQLAKKLRDLARFYNQSGSENVSSNNGGTDGTKFLPGLQTAQTRSDELAEFLKKHGPLKFSELIANAGLPKGTIFGLLRKHKDRFKKNSDGLWIAAENGGK